MDKDKKPDLDLESFRKQWKRELGLESPSTEPTSSSIADIGEEPKKLPKVGEEEDEEEKREAEDDEDEEEDEEDDDIMTEEKEIHDDDEAHSLFLQGVNCEKTGHFYDAIRFYKKALTLVPDIEHRFTQRQVLLHGSESQQKAKRSSEKKRESADDEEEEEDDLKLKFLCELQQKGWCWFQKARPDERAHFQNLPEEVIKYILRWIVSSDLDVRSLDVLSCASKGFYVACRDEQLWLKICERIWGTAGIFIHQEEFSSYREMFLTRPRVRFDGCYISKITYVRAGENSFQDQSYRPWHVVEYYRYIFFNPHGQFFFLTTSEPPQVTIPHFRDPVNQTKFHNLLVGHYRLEDNRIYGECWNPHKIRTKASNNNSNNANITYNMVLKVVHLKRRFNNGLAWEEYFLNIESHAGTIIKNDFDIVQVKFPNFVFSRVKSFTKEAQKVLV